MSGWLPTPATPGDFFAQASLEVLRGIDDKLGQLLARVPAPPRQPDGVVELREPAAPDPAPGPAAVEVAEPAPARTPRRRTTTSKKGKGA